LLTALYPGLRAHNKDVMSNAEDHT
jgi:hypothetical protein